MIKPVYFPAGDTLLSAMIHYPKQTLNKHVPAVIFVHGFVGSKVGEHRLFVKAANYFSERGFLVFRFDFGGCGESEGDYSHVTLTKQVKELQSAIDYVLSIDQVDPNLLTVVGHSLGGAVSSLTASRDERIKRLILWSPVARPYTDIVRITSEEAVTQAHQNGVFDYKGFNLSHFFFENLKLHHPLKAIRNYFGPAYIIHAADDQDVPADNAIDYYDALKENRAGTTQYSYIQDADHTFSSYLYEQQLFDTTFEWVVGIETKCEANII
ncbi:alpha/beta hydrolase family protein [Alkalihalobacterium chitinilyticum]|uniref:Alpha/beta fold hydrolase n=1 Tax=Alkalihalobacterium chitinilyticum TaxID=2980103 RepID=A0ABT5VKY3_9BACI|nr:alpha/beta fold hydrolase [Alkalihalobacterium chitinilyticum]MDE5416107.1 alpha/beta fold hydrolase [Alkalihalobacterium chitinilyticum]